MFIQYKTWLKMSLPSNAMLPEEDSPMFKPSSRSLTASSREREESGERDRERGEEREREERESHNKWII